MPVSTKRQSRSTKHPAKAQGSTFSLWLIGISVVVLGAIIFAINLSNLPNTPTTSLEAELPAAWVNGKSLGDPAAPVVIQVWEDFLCPHCKEWTEQIEPQLINDYIKNGKARLEFQLLPLQGFEPGSSMAGMAAECAVEQGKFWALHHRLFAAQDQGQNGYRVEALTRLAADAGLDKTAFSQCLINLKHQPTVQQSLEQATALGLNSTPSLLINGKRVTNPFDYTALKAELDLLVD